VIVAFVVIERDAVLIGWLLLSQAQVARLGIVSTWLAVLGAAQPPW